MREIILSNSEKSFVSQALGQCKRLDGRALDEFREPKIFFGKNWGSCLTTLGETKVFAQVSCEIQEPKAIRPNEGLLFINVELSPMAAPQFEISNSRSELNVHLNRMLEKCLKESKAVDLESLCIIADEKVWTLRVDVSVINHEGNLTDCVSIAALAALAHFKRPDTTTSNHEVIIHSAAEKDLIPIVLHHYPICVTFAFAHENTIVADPSLVEERVAEASLTLCINGHRELCGMHLTGAALLAPRHIIRCSTNATVRAKYVVNLIKTMLQQDLQERELGSTAGLVKCLEINKITAAVQNRLKIQLRHYNSCYNSTLPEKVFNKNLTADECNQNEQNVVITDLGENSAELTVEEPLEKKNRKKYDPPTELKYGEGSVSTWEIPTSNLVKEVTTLLIKDEKSVDDSDILLISKDPKKIDQIDLDDEEVYVMNANDMETAEKVSTKNQINFVEISTSKLQTKKQKRKKLKK